MRMIEIERSLFILTFGLCRNVALHFFLKWNQKHQELPARPPKRAGIALCTGGESNPDPPSLLESDDTESASSKNASSLNVALLRQNATIEVALLPEMERKKTKGLRRGGGATRNQYFQYSISTPPSVERLQFWLEGRSLWSASVPYTTGAFPTLGSGLRPLRILSSPSSAPAETHKYITDALVHVMAHMSNAPTKTTQTYHALAGNRTPSAAKL
ncbi:hypothetical protein K438DRAFT_1776188 [Mycena galopus ATCC 62051]|nr:hypothetical protein K438DRAFT_1776188 [Mycena galopus ATCC 62051]